MKLLLLLLLATVTLHAQVVPTTPRKFTTRKVGTGTGSTSTVVSGGGSATVGVPTPPTAPAVVRTTFYTTLAATRQWTDVNGRALVGSLIAFEDQVVETQANQAPAQPPKLTKKPTVVKDGKSRLLVNRKPVEVELAKLRAEDREFIENLKAAVEKAPLQP